MLIADGQMARWSSVEIVFRVLRSDAHFDGAVGVGLEEPDPVRTVDALGLDKDGMGVRGATPFAVLGVLRLLEEVLDFVLADGPPVLQGSALQDHVQIVVLSQDLVEVVVLKVGLAHQHVVRSVLQLQPARQPNLLLEVFENQRNLTSPLQNSVELEGYLIPSQHFQVESVQVRLLLVALTVHLSVGLDVVFVGHRLAAGETNDALAVHLQQEVLFVYLQHAPVALQEHEVLPIDSVAFRAVVLGQHQIAEPGGHLLTLDSLRSPSELANILANRSGVMHSARGLLFLHTQV